MILSGDTAHRETFFRKNRRGGVALTVNETYLRNDSTMLGNMDGKDVNVEDFLALLQSAHSARVLIVDTNVILHQIDLIETEIELIDLVIVPLTTLSELKKLNLSVFKRMTTLIQSESRHFLVYANICKSDTFSER